MWIVCQADNSHEMSRLVLSEKKKKKKKLSSAAVVIGALRVKKGTIEQKRRMPFQKQRAVQNSKQEVKKLFPLY